jgi:hypothetical protein
LCVLHCTTWLSMMLNRRLFGGVAFGFVALAVSAGLAASLARRSGGTRLCAFLAGITPILVMNFPSLVLSQLLGVRLLSFRILQALLWMMLWVLLALLLPPVKRVPGSSTEERFS